MRLRPSSTGTCYRLSQKPEGKVPRAQLAVGFEPTTPQSLVRPWQMPVSERLASSCVTFILANGSLIKQIILLCANIPHNAVTRGPYNQDHLYSV